MRKTSEDKIRCHQNSDGSKSLNNSKDIPLQLMFYSRFLKCNLTPEHPLSKAGHQMVYDPSPQPVVHVGHIGHALCRVPLMPCFLQGNLTPTIPQSYSKDQPRKFKSGQADTATRLGSRLYEINQWMWTYGRPKLRDMSYLESQETRKRKLEEAVHMRRDTRRRSKVLKETHSIVIVRRRVHRTHSESTDESSEAD